MKSKDELRHDIRVSRAQLTLADIEERGKKAIENLRALPELQESKAIACYLSKTFEVQTQRFIESCLSAGKRVCVPRHIDGERGYAWSWVVPGGAWRDGPWHIAEPAHYRAVDRNELDLAIVPAVAVDPAGNRLGHGGGNVDRLLMGLDAPHVALVFDFQILDEIPVNEHDVPVQIIVSEKKVHRVEK